MIITTMIMIIINNNNIKYDNLGAHCTAHQRFRLHTTERTGYI